MKLKEESVITVISGTCHCELCSILYQILLIWLSLLSDFLQ